MRSRSAAVAVGAVAVTAAAVAVWLFPRAFPTVVLQQSLTRDIALARADSFFRAHALAPAGARRAVSFQGDDSLRTFVELAGGGLDSLNALARGKDIAPFTWSVRAFVPGNPREARVDFAPDGRIIGFERELAEADRRPAVSPDSGRRLAEQVMARWINDGGHPWTVVSSSYETQKTSGRIDRSYIFERSDRRIGGAPIRAEAVIAGDTPSELRPFVEIPGTFQRRYAEMRSWNNLIARLATLGILGLMIAAIIALTRYARARQVRWREAMLVGAVIGAFILASSLNGLPGSWFDYDTAMSPVTFVAMQVLLSLAAGVSTGLLVGCTLAAAEASVRHAFPRHLDWWKLWRYRGTREVAARVGGGYAVAAIAFAYVGLFYLITRTLFGWWVPAELLDDPNQIASPMPWIGAIALSLQAGVWEESLFRALPLSLLSLTVGQRSGRRWWMAAGVVGSAIIFGFAHASYASWPPYSRGVEIFLDACFWAVLFLQFGLLVTVIAHFLYDAVLFGIFAASGHAAIYHVTAGIILAALLAPAFAVLWRMIRQRGLVAAPEDARFAAWRPVAREERPRQARAREAGILTRRAHRLALAAAAIGVLAALGIPPEPSLGPEFTVERGRILATADSMLRGRGGNPRGWTRLSATTTNPDKSWSRFLRENGIEDQAGQLASSYAPAAWWTVRYVHTRGSTAQRDEEWQARVSPDGKPLGLRHVIPDSAGRATSDPATVRQVALTALARSGLDTARLEEVEYQETPRPARRDVTVTYTDTTVKLPEGAAARARVEIAGQEPLLVGRRVELPETFLRSDRQRQTTRLMIGAVGGMLLVVLLIAGAIIVRNRLPSALHDGPLDRRARLLLVGALALLAILNGLNSLPAQLSSYDTAQPWSTFLSRIGLGFVGPVVSSLLLLGMLLVVDALRRRVGIPMLPDGLRARPADVLVAGLGIGGIAYAAMHLHTLILRSDIPSPPSTSLDNAIPWLSGIFGIPAETIAAVMLLGIPVLVVAGLTARWSWRALLGAVILILVAIVWANSPAGDADPTGLALLIGGIVLLVAATVAWGGGSAWSWIIAALFFQMLGALPQAVYGPEWQTRTAAVLAALAAVGLIGLILRQAMNRHLQGSVA